MEFNTKKVEAMGKAVAEEIKRCGFGSDDPLYDVKNAMRELQRQIGLAGMADFKEFKALAWYNVEEITRYSKVRHHEPNVGEQNDLQAENIS